jgi:hypothetical protein
MTAKTSQKLADVLRAAGFEDLAKRAETDEFHDFLSPHALPEMMLDEELVDLIKRGYPAAKDIRARHHEGEFDASTAESDEWARSEDGKATFNELLGSKK